MTINADRKKTFELNSFSQNLDHKNEDCLLPKASGNCKALSLNFYYDWKQEKCLKFFYTGCQGNENRFETLGECQRQCMNGEWLNFFWMILLSRNSRIIVNLTRSQIVIARQARAHVSSHKIHSVWNTIGLTYRHFWIKYCFKIRFACGVIIHNYSQSVFSHNLRYDMSCVLTTLYFQSIITSFYQIDSRLFLL